MGRRGCKRQWAILYCRIRVLLNATSSLSGEKGREFLYEMCPQTQNMRYKLIYDEFVAITIFFLGTHSKSRHITKTTNDFRFTYGYSGTT